jgi:hypothetical protein
VHDYITEYEKILCGTEDILEILGQNRHLNGYRAQLLLAEQYFRSAEYYKVLGKSVWEPTKDLGQTML